METTNTFFCILTHRLARLLRSRRLYPQGGGPLVGEGQAHGAFRASGESGHYVWAHVSF